MRIPEDADVRNDHFQCRGIILKGDKVLVMFRRKKDKGEYYVFPGGHMRHYEKPIETVEREVEEETTIKVKNLKPAYDFINHTEPEMRDYYFVGEWVSGEPTLSGEESRESNDDNYYEPMWVDIDDIQELNLYPRAAKEWVHDFLNRLIED
jgi:8-oxo-dGTP pyrophosphatase MutT (NUDIX family)